ncbi:protein FAR1-RELATED SEQUENCE 5-like [Cornus florida]|uniref:protein FAR1-RELATED SEQUENCE 5-like n=1 Tax=Cornus florida TaxID=4283 RepID=UPI00289F05FC|nr:protein FAR1-RELATED SEQUENCE 5-like [Cornus florida]
MELANDSIIQLRFAYELMGREAGGRECLGYTKLDQKNYLRSRRKRYLEFGNTGSLLRYFQKQSLEILSFFYAVQLDEEKQITNIFWADAKMIINYGLFGDVMIFDTNYKVNKAHSPFAVFIGFNHHRETVIFGASLMYDETTDSFSWLFETFLEVMLGKSPKIIFTDQDATMAKALSFVMPGTCQLLCTWHII